MGDGGSTIFGCYILPLPQNVRHPLSEFHESMSKGCNLFGTEVVVFNITGILVHLFNH